LIASSEQNKKLEQEIANLKQQLAAQKLKSDNEISDKLSEIHKLKQTISEGENTLKQTKREAQEKE